MLILFFWCKSIQNQKKIDGNSRLIFTTLRLRNIENYPFLWYISSSWKTNYEDLYALQILAKQGGGF